MLASKMKYTFLFDAFSEYNQNSIWSFWLHGAVRPVMFMAVAGFVHRPDFSPCTAMVELAVVFVHPVNVSMFPIGVLELPDRSILYA
ncbi:hypothetical protein D3C85_1016810 [compost metagenome]